jgi:hypothetical protein
LPDDCFGVAEAEVRDAVEKLLQAYTHLQPSYVGTKAAMNAGAEGKVTVRGSVKHDCVRI